MLLSDPAVASVLEREVVACWRMLQPAPLITIDFGDGRVIKRTLKGNTALYLCRADGVVLDVFPGLYTADDFLAELAGSLALVRKLELLAPNAPGTALIEEYRAGANGLLDPAARALRDVRTSIGKGAIEAPVLEAVRPAEPSRLNRGKELVEAPISDAADAGRTNVAKREVEAPVAGAAWAAAPRLNASKRKVEASVARALERSEALARLLRAESEKQVARQAPAPGEAESATWRAAFERHAARLIDGSAAPRSAVELRAEWSDEERAATPAERGRIAIRRDSATNRAVLRPLARLLIASGDELVTVEALRHGIFVDLLHVAIDDPDLGLRDTLLPGTDDDHR